MKTKINLAIFLVASLILSVACTSKQNKENTTIEDVKKETKEAVNEAKDYAAEEYTALLKSIDSFIDSQTKTIEGYKTRVKNLENDVKKQLNTKITKMESDIQQLKDKREAYKSAATDKKEELTQEIETIKDAIDKGVKTFEKELKEQEQKKK